MHEHQSPIAISLNKDGVQPSRGNLGACSMGGYRTELRLLQCGKSLPAVCARALPAGGSAALSDP
eukprot:2582563-Heterocapsa_arctica.AAC.1